MRAKLQINLDVIIELNDGTAEAVRHAVEREVLLAIGAGMLTNGHDAEVESYSPQVAVKLQATQVAPTT